MQAKEVNIPESGRLFTEKLWDYAGIFPPAQLPLEAAVKNFLNYWNDDRRNFLSTFVVPLNRIAELLKIKANIAPEFRQMPLSLLTALPETGASAAEFERQLNFRLAEVEKSPAHFLPEKVEVKISVDWWTENNRQLPEYLLVLKKRFGPLNPTLRLFLELQQSQTQPLTKLDPIFEMVRGLNSQKGPEFFLKIRCGGPDGSFVPPAEFLIRFFERISEYGLGFKATAGLHHPLNNDDKIMKTTAYGFLNLFLAAMFIKLNIADAQNVLALLKSRDVSVFRFHGGGISWKQYFIDNAQIKALRESFAISIGSCSIEEPLADLQENNWFITNTERVK